MKYSHLLPELKRNCLIIDIETCAEFSNGQEINIHSQHDLYLQNAKVKWFGAYSYTRNIYYLLDAQKNKNTIKELLNNHNIIIGFNSIEFDYVILQNNNYIIDPKKRIIHIDCMQILGESVFLNKDGFAFKNRGGLMGYKFKNNSLRSMAEGMKLDFQKGDIDYNIFKKNSWTEQEETQIKFYLKNDILITRQMFEKLWDFWLPFTDMLDEKFVKDFSWIRNSIASLTYKTACSYLGLEPTYSEKIGKKEEMGGKVLLPKYEEANNVWYVDFVSLYPHLFCHFNLFAEITDPNKVLQGWHGNNMFQVRGYYDITKEHKLNTQIKSKLAERIRLKKTAPQNPMVYTIKIFLNGLYGVARSPIFEKIHTPNCGYDCCWLGQQCQAYTIKRMNDFGFEEIYGDTDGVMFLINNISKNNRGYVQQCLKIIVEEIKRNSPFPVETFDINIEGCLDYIMFPFSEEAIEDDNGEHIKIDKKIVKENRGKKKNYVYIKDKNGKKEVVLVGLPIIKSSATALGIKIYNEVLEALIIQNNRAKFTYDFIKKTINDYIKREEILTLIAQEYKIKPFHTYKLASQIQAQISKGYLNGQDGVIHLIKNNKVGKVGKGTKYCTIEEAKEAKLTEKDLDLVKLWNELMPFVDSKIAIESKADIIPENTLNLGQNKPKAGIKTINTGKDTLKTEENKAILPQFIENKEVKPYFEE